MKRYMSPKNDPRRRGVTVVFVAISLLTLFACASLAIDVGYICALTAEAQNTADSGALGGANLLQEKKSDTLRSRVLRLIAMNQETQGFLSLDDQIIEVGTWDSVHQEFTALPEEEWEDNGFAVRVRAARNNVSLFFAPIMGHHETDVWREAVAVGSRPCKGIWGLEGVRVIGDVETDSYVGADGPYAALTANSNGDLCSNEDIRIYGSVVINGDAMAGFGYPVDLKGAADVAGLTTSNLDGLGAPAPEFGDISFINDNGLIGLTDGGRSVWGGGGTDFRLGANDNITIPGGSYYINTFTAHSTSEITFSGPVTLYIEGDIRATGAGIINESGDASILTILSNAENISIGGSEDLYASIYAPYAEADIFGNAGFYGALVGREVYLRGSTLIHVDESLPLNNMFTSPPPFLVK